jgi:transcriptional regulator with XRE-family HTH domain
LGSRKLVGVILLISLVTELHQPNAKCKLRGILWQQSAKSLQLGFAQKMDLEKLATIIRVARGDRSQGKFARDLGVNPGTLRNWELGDSEPSLDNLKAIADASGRNLLQLIAEITGVKSETLPETHTAEDVMAIAFKLEKVEQFRLIQLLIAQMAVHAGIEIAED